MSYWTDAVDEHEVQPLLDFASVGEPQKDAGVKPKIDEAKRKIQENKNQIMLVVYCVLLLFASTGNSIFFKKMTNHWPNYQYFLSQLTTVIYVPIFLGVLLQQRYTGLITREMDEFPKRKFFVMGALDACASILMVFGGNKTRGSTQTLLSQGVIPVSILFSIIFLGTKYRPAQYFGALMIMAGVFLDFYPKMTGEGAEEEEDSSVFWAAFFFCGNIPTAFSAVYKEIAFAAVDLNVYFLQFWVAVWQLLFGIPLAFINTVPLPGQPTLEVSELPVDIWNGMRCMAGYNTEHPEGEAEDDCVGAWQPVVIYMIFNIMFNIFLVLVIKHGSAALMYIVSTVRLPLANIAFSLPFIMGDDAVPMNGYDIAALLVILSGLIVYRWASSTNEKSQKEMELSPEEAEEEGV